jgi:hypothetical protein
MEHENNRAKLYAHFDECVKQSLSFLEQLKFVPSQIKNGEWQYTSAEVIVGIYYERISYEIYLTITLRSENIRVTIDEIISGWLNRKYYYATDEKMINKCLGELSDLLQAFAIPFMNGSVSYFRDIDISRKINRQTALLNDKFKASEAAATAAWREHRYSDVLNIYNAISQYLTPTQKKRFSLCEKYLDLSKKVFK